MVIVGLTGQTGAGKSTVCEKLKTYGCYHIDADRIAHSVYEKGSAVLNELCKAFGSDILNSDGTLNRKTLAAIAFSSEENILKLNSAVHPAVTSQIREIIEEQRVLGTKTVIIDAIALFESGENKLCDFTAAVTAPREIRKNRVKKRDNLTDDEANLRINAQADEQFYIDRADVIVKNYLPYDLNDEVKKIVLWINKKESEKE